MADRWTPLPMPDLVIDVMNKLCDEDTKKKTSSSHDSSSSDVAEQQGAQQDEQQGEEVVVPTARGLVEAIDEDPLGAPGSDLSDTPGALFQDDEETDELLADKSLRTNNKSAREAKHIAEKRYWLVK